jgi:hypothetical protein
MGYGLDCLGSIIGGARFNLSSTAFRPALRPTQLHIQWVPGALSLGVKRSGRVAEHSPTSSAELKNVGDIPPFPTCLHDTMLN